MTNKYEWIGWPYEWVYEFDDDEQVEADSDGYENEIRFLEDKIRRIKNATKKSAIED